MGRSIKKHREPHVYDIVLLVSIACVLQIAESLIPHPIPGLRLGLANMISLIAMVSYGFGPAMEVAVLRTVLSSFIMGSFMSPTFMLSFSGAVVSTLVMGALYRLATHARCRFSIIGISVAGALSHNIVQLSLAYLLLIKHSGIFMFFPWLSFGAVVTGWFNGVVSGKVCRKLGETGAGPITAMTGAGRRAARRTQNAYSPGTSILHRAPAEAKIISVILLSILVLAAGDLSFYLAAFILLAAAAALSRTPMRFLISKARRYSSIMLVAFALPVFFNFGTHTIFNLGTLEITSEGLNTGTIFAARILFLLLASSLMVRTTSPEEMTRGFARLLSPLRVFGISETRAASILSLAWSAIPDLWDIAKEAIREARLGKARSPRDLAEFLSDLIVKICASAGIGTEGTAERSAVRWEGYTENVFSDDNTSLILEKEVS